MSRATLNRYGGIGALEMPGFQPRVHKQILSVCDPGHFMHGKVNTHRYAIEGDSIFALRNLQLSEDIAEKGVEQPGGSWWHNDVGHIISGTRRWTALEVANGLREADALDPFLMRFEINSRWSEAVAAEKWRRANQKAIQNDVLTRLEGAALDIERGVDPGRVAEVWEPRAISSCRPRSSWRRCRTMSSWRICPGLPSRSRSTARSRARSAPRSCSGSRMRCETTSAWNLSVRWTCCEH